MTARRSENPGSRCAMRGVTCPLRPTIILAADFAGRSRRARRSVKRLAGAVFLLWAVGAASPLAAQQDLGSGVRFRVDASVSLEPKSPLLEQIRRADSVQAEGIVQLQLRISANSRELRYFGFVAEDVPLRLPPADPVWRTAWEEQLCHQRRGIPKLTVMRLSGRWPASSEQPESRSAAAAAQLTASNGETPAQSDAAVASRPAAAAPSIVFTSSIRRIGLPLSHDELVPGIRLRDGTDDVGPYYALRAQTKDTRLNADLRLYTFACTLDAAAPPPEPKGASR